MPLQDRGFIISEPQGVAGPHYQNFMAVEQPSAVLCSPPNPDPITSAIFLARDLPSPNPGPKVEEVLEL